MYRRISLLVLGLLLMGSFGGSTSFPAISSDSDSTIANALTIHENAWETVVEKAEKDKYYKYGIYTTRTLAVKHPEIYLQADGLFVEIATTNEGFKKAHEIRNVHDDYFFGRNKEGPPFSFEDVDFTAYKIIESKEYYPEGYPVFPFLDRRVLPVATTLKSVENHLTQLEKGVQYYFAEKGGNEKGMYLIYCDNGNTYVYLYSNSLVWVKILEPVQKIDGNPILVFNEQYVWYPLMERDDSSKDKTLEDVITTYATDVKTPLMQDFEKEMVEKLKEVTTLKDYLQKDMAAMAAFRTAWYLNRYTDAESFTNLYKSGIDFVAERRALLKYGNYLSPITAYLAAVAGEYQGEEKIKELTREYLRYTTMLWDEAHGHVWFCDLVEQTVLESYATRGGHCIVQAPNIAAALDLAHIGNYWIQGYLDKEKVSSPPYGHDWLYIPEFDLIFSNGTIEMYGTVLCHHFFKPIPYDRIDFVQVKDTWAYILDLEVIGTASPGELAGMLEELHGVHNDEMFILEDRETTEGIPLEDFVHLLEEEQAAPDLLESGLEKKKKGELEGTLQDLYTAYTKFKDDTLYTEVLCEKEGTELTLQDVEEELVFLCLHFIRNGDEALKKGQNEDTLQNFAFVYKYWQSLYYSLGLVLESEEYKKEYAEIGITYTTGEVEEKIRVCVAEIENEAERLKAEGQIEEAEKKYDLIINFLIEANWKNKEDISKFEAKKSDIKAVSGRVQIVVIGILIVAAVIMYYKMRK